jgi:hypothetical protein
MPQLSSTDRLLIATNDTANSLKQPHPDFPFIQVGDKTIAALAQLATILKNKFKNQQRQNLCKHLSRPLKLVLTSPMQHNYHKRSQRPISANKARSTRLLTRVATPMTDQAVSTRVLARTQNLFPRNLSQDDFWNIETANQAIALGANNWTNQHFSHAVLHLVTGKKWSTWHS